MSIKEDSILRHALKQTRVWLEDVTETSKKSDWKASPTESLHYADLNDHTKEGVNRIYLTPSYHFDDTKKVHSGAVIDFKPGASLDERVLSCDKFLTCTITVPILCMGSVNTVSLSSPTSSQSQYSGDSKSSATTRVNEEIRLFTENIKKTNHNRPTLFGALGIHPESMPTGDSMPEKDVMGWHPTLGEGGMLFVGKTEDQSRCIVVSSHVDGMKEEIVAIMRNIKGKTLKKFIHDMPYYRKMRELAYRNACRLAYEFSLRIHAHINYCYDTDAHADLSMCRATPMMAVPDIVQYSNCFEYLSGVHSEDYKEHEYSVIGRRNSKSAVSMKKTKGSNEGMCLLLGGSTLNPTFSQKAEKKFLCWSDPRKHLVLVSIPYKKKRVGCCYVPLMHFSQRSEKRPLVATPRQDRVNWLDAESDESLSQRDVSATPSRFFVDADRLDKNRFDKNDMMAHIRKCLGNDVKETLIHAEILYMI